MAFSWFLSFACGYVVAAAVGFSQAGPSAAQESKATTAVIEGTVVNSVTGAPLKKTILTLRPTGSSLESNERGTVSSIETSDDGSFRFPNVAPGPYWFMAERAGFAPQYFNARNSDTRGSVIRAHSGEEIKSLIFKLIPNAIISGKVLDADGDPLRANVVVFRYAYRTDGKTIQAFANASTGAMGEYSISIPPGKFLLVASPALNNVPISAAAQATPGTASPEGPVLIYAPTFYPNSLEQYGAVELQASAGVDLHSIDFRIDKVKAYRVRGKVSAANGGLQLVARNSPASSRPPQFGGVKEDGSFEFPAVLPGTYHLMMNGPRGGSIANQPIVVTDHHLDGLAVQFSPMPELKGTVTIEGDSKKTVEGMQVGFDSFDNGTNPLGRIDKDGKFTVRGILPGRYHPWAGLGGGGRYVKSIHYQERDVTDTGIDVTEGISGTVDILISLNAAELSGVVVDDDDKPCAGVSVVLVPDSGAYLGYNSVTTDAQGHFKVGYLRPGDYKVYALEGILYLAWFDKEYMKPYSSNGIPLSVHEKDKKFLSLKVIADPQK